MSNFDRAVEHVIQEEGGYVNDPHDAGSETKYGISKRAFPEIDIKELTVGDAKRLYLEHYWNLLPMDSIPDPLAFCLLDTAVNMGIGRASKLLQAACRVTQDGIIGAHTIEAAQNVSVNSFMNERRAFYHTLDQFPLYGKGWLARCDRVEKAA